MLSAILTLTVLLRDGATPAKPIDRKALVKRHDIEIRSFSSRRPLQVGNGEFAFSFDVTGLQTFTPFNTMSNWGWQSSPMPAGESLDQFAGQEWMTHGRIVRYPMPDLERPQLSQWLAANPHRINLGRIGLMLAKQDGSTVLPSDLKQVRQSLNLWSGVATSRFELEGVPVMVKTACAPSSDTLAVQVFSPLIRQGRISVFFACPGDDPRYFADYVGDWTSPSKLRLQTSQKDRSATLTRELDGGGHSIAIKWDGEAEVKACSNGVSNLKVLKAEYGVGDQWTDVSDLVRGSIRDDRLSVRAGPGMPDPAPGKGKSARITYAVGGVAQVVEVDENGEILIASSSEKNRFVLTPSRSSGSLTFASSFTPSKRTAPAPIEVFNESVNYWPRFWKSGAAVDFSESTDPRWKELERRVVLSQYLMRVNEAGSLPPQESGLVNNGWYGRFHMEMIWWHGAHWALWNRWPHLNRYLEIYEKVLPGARSLAKAQGYQGARWPKCLGPNLREWPNEIHALLIWQQPHPIFFAELAYRANPTPETLKKWAPIVEATADFMASYAHLNLVTGRYDLGPPLVPVSENVDSRTNRNPTFELSYWRFGLRTANQWRVRMGKSIDQKWHAVAKSLAPLPKEDGVYVLSEGIKDMWGNFNFEHPALAGAYGLLPGDGVDHMAMKRTLDKVLATWRFDHVWGWDLPMLAVCAARLGEPEAAVDLLLHMSGQFQFDEAGLASGGPYPYFPSNGGLLYAVGMMAAGWSGGPNSDSPGFPSKGWRVRSEGFATAL
jgi:hypothetical protein